MKNQEITANQNSPTINDIVAALQLVLESKNNSKSDMLLEMLTEDFKEKRDLKEEEKRQQIEIKKQNGQILENLAAQQKAYQDYCSHLKPNNEPNLAAQRDHSQNIHWFCQECQKSWKGGEIPPHLGKAFDSNRIGGPSL